MVIEQSHKVKTAAGSYPVTLAEAKLHLKMDDISADDDLITSLIIAATQNAQDYTGIFFIDTVIEEVFDSFPKGSKQSLYLTVGEVSSVASVKYYDENEVLQTWNSSNYIVDTYRSQARIATAQNADFPTYSTDRINSVVVEYTSGFGSAASNVPDVIKAAIKLTIGHLYTYREDSVKKLPTAAEYLLNPYRVGLI